MQSILKYYIHNIITINFDLIPKYHKYILSTYKWYSE